MHNELTTKECIVISISLQVALIGLIGFNKLGFETFLLRQIVGFICLSLIPGALTLRVLKIRGISNWERLFYSVGLSLFIVMLTGVLINFAYPLIGITKPITTWPLVITFTVIVFLLALLAYYRNKGNEIIAQKVPFNFKGYISISNLYLTLLPLLAVIGALVVTYFYNNTILLVLIILIALVPLFAIGRKDNLENIYPYAIFMIALALMLHVTMVTKYPMRLNVDYELFFQNLVAQKGYWDVSLSHPVNSTLSVVMMAPIFSSILNINAYWLFKIIYPIIFSLVPVILFSIYSKQLDKKSAFFAVLFFIFSAYFFIEAPLLRRQQIAMLYYSLIILLILDHDLLPVQKTILAISFSFSLIVSHYAMSYICLIIFFATYLLFAFFRLLVNRGTLDKIKNRFSFIDIATYKMWAKTHNLNIFTLSFICLFIVIAISWSLYIAKGSGFVSVSVLGKNIFENISNFLDPATKSPLIESALGGGFLSAPLLNKIYRIVQYSTQLLIVVGFVGVLIQPARFSKEYVLLSLTNMIFLVASILVPFLSIWMNMSRIYFVLLVVLSPFCIIGWGIIWNVFARIKGKLFSALDSPKIIYDWKFGKTKINIQTVYVLLILIPYFLFNVGFVFACGGFTEETRDQCRIPSSASLSYGKIDTGYHTESEIRGAMRVPKIINSKSIVYADKWIGYDIVSVWHSNTRVFTFAPEESYNGYAYFRKWNIDKKVIKRTLSEEEKRIYYPYIGVSGFQKNREKLYANGGSEIWGKVYLE